MVQTSVKRERIYGADFLRLLCAIGIICYHFAFLSAAEPELIFQCANGQWGYIIVTIFFIMSGAMLYYNYETISNIKLFYFKRWKTIYPVFYLLYIFFFFVSVLKAGKFFFLEGVAPWRIIFTVLGIDGYVNYSGFGISTYYLIGDWFLGAIIILYALYPLVVKIMKRFSWILTAVLIVGFAFVFCVDLSQDIRQRNIITCLLAFVLGMMYVKYRKVLNTYIAAIITGAIALALCFIKIPVSDNTIIREIMAICFFVSLMYAGEKVMKLKMLKNVVVKLAALTFPVFLIQHIFINDIILPVFNPDSTAKAYLLLLIIIILIFIFAKAADVLAKAITNGRLVKRIELSFSGEKNK